VRTGILARCLPCRDHTNKLRRTNKSPEAKARHADYMRAYYKGNRSRFRNSELKRKYGITLEDYSARLLQQGGRCAVCPATIGEAKRNRALFVDHDHETGEIRGLLCGGCNAALGFLRDRPARMHSLVAYLMKWL